MSRASFLVIGEALVDVVTGPTQSVEHPGGSPANVAITLGRLGHDVALSTALGDDRRGTLVIDWLRDSHVQVNATRLPRTSTATARLSTDGSAAYTFDIRWPAPPFPSTPPIGARHVHTGSIGSWMSPGADAVAALIETSRAHATVSFDPNIRAALITDHNEALTRVEQMAINADIVKLSDEDLIWLHPDAQEATVVERWINAGVSVVIVTRGAAGARAYTKNGPPLEIEALRINVVDTIGAGDTFTGALLASLNDLDLLGSERRESLTCISSSDLHHVLERAAAAAAITVSRPGADPPWAQELSESLRGQSTM